MRNSTDSLTNYDERHTISSRHGVVVARHLEGLRMHQWKVWRLGTNKRPAALLAQADNQHDAELFANRIVDALDHATR